MFGSNLSLRDVCDKSLRHPFEETIERIGYAYGLGSKTADV